MTQEAIEQLISRVFPALPQSLYQTLQRRIQDYFFAGDIQDISQLPVTTLDFTRVMLFSPFTAEYITVNPLTLDRLGKSGDLDTSYAPGDIKKKLGDTSKYLHGARRPKKKSLARREATASVFNLMSAHYFLQF